MTPVTSGLRDLLIAVAVTGRQQIDAEGAVRLLLGGTA
jgi:hypothetical protein